MRAFPPRTANPPASHSEVPGLALRSARPRTRDRRGRLAQPTTLHLARAVDNGHSEPPEALKRADPGSGEPRGTPPVDGPRARSKCAEVVVGLIERPGTRFAGRTSFLHALPVALRVGRSLPLCLLCLPLPADCPVRSAAGLRDVHRADEHRTEDAGPERRLWRRAQVSPPPTSFPLSRAAAIECAPRLCARVFMRWVRCAVTRKFTRRPETHCPRRGVPRPRTVPRRGRGRRLPRVAALLARGQGPQCPRPARGAASAVGLRVAPERATSQSTRRRRCRFRSSEARGRRRHIDGSLRGRAGRVVSCGARARPAAHGGYEPTSYDHFCI